MENGTRAVAIAASPQFCPIFKSDFPMPTLMIDHCRVEVPSGATVLDAARKAGIDIPTLCYREGYKPATSCLVCMVKIVQKHVDVDSARGIEAVDGMEVESQTDEVHAVRRTALELLLSDHEGDCLAPCYFACPAHMDIPTMLRHIAAGDLRAAIQTVKEDIALPAILGYVCPRPCEKGCRRASADGAVAICGLKRLVAEADLASGDPYVPECKPSSGKRVAVVGAGPTGLSAAYYLRRLGHAVTVLDAQPLPGGRLRYRTAAGLPEVRPEILDAEIGQVFRLGIEFRPSTRVGDEPTWDALLRQFDAVLAACGAVDPAQMGRWGLPAGPQGIAADRQTYQTKVPRLFAAGNAIRGQGLIVRSAADGKEVALAIDQYLSGQPVVGRPKPFSVRRGRLSGEQVQRLVALSGQTPRHEPACTPPAFAIPEAVEQAHRCLHCDCHALGTCRLRSYAAQYGADPQRFRGERANFRWEVRQGRVIYEPGKCIDCGLCIAIADAAKEPLGLTFVGRGFDVRVAVPFDRSLDEALTRVAAQCVAACPTAALALRPDAPAP